MVVPGADDGLVPLQRAPLSRDAQREAEDVHHISVRLGRRVRAARGAVAFARPIAMHLFSAPII